MTRGAGLVELLVASLLGLAVLSLLAFAVAGGARALAGAGARGEAEDTAQMALEAFGFDARRAGFDPAAAGVPPLSEARPDRVGFASDLDGNGTVDATSEETTVHVCAVALGRLSRIIGRQSLPLADGVTRCTFRYFDRDGVEIVAPAAGLDAAGRARVSAVALDLALVPTRLHRATERTTTVALRSGS
jgi:hypothetical protein